MASKNNTKRDWKLFSINIFFTVGIGVFAFGTINTYIQVKDLSMREDKDRAQQVYYEISELINRRLYRFKKKIWFYNNPDTSLMSFKNRNIQLSNEYGEVLDSWNSQLSRNTVLLRMRFGKWSEEYFIDSVHNNFYRFHNRLNSIKQNYWHEPILHQKLDSLENAIKPFSIKIDSFNIYLVRAIEEGNVGESRINQR